MRLLLIAIVAFSLGSGPTLAQTGIGAESPSSAVPGSPPSSPASLTNAPDLTSLQLLQDSASGATSQRQPPSRPQSRQNAYDGALAACVQMWDSGTHMTKQEWSRTCKRVQTRLDNLKVDAIMPKTKSRLQKSASDKKQAR
jgi:hypothetical protein